MDKSVATANLQFVTVAATVASQRVALYPEAAAEYSAESAEGARVGDGLAVKSLVIV